MKPRLMITATKLAALAKNAAAVPQRATTALAAAGPMMREPWKAAWLREIACGRSSRSTSCG